MPTPPLDSATTVADDEPLCADCVRCQGLCAFHEKHILPQLKEPSWPQMIGESYVCTEAHCGDHAACTDVPDHSAPRHECGCHNCSQRRWARARAKQNDEPSPAAIKAKRRNERKVSRIARLEHCMKGGFSRTSRTWAA